MNDLVSYNEKHNSANGEDNNDGESHNRSWNCGTEGETDDPEILALRQQQKRNLLTTLLLSQGVPMLLAGDEISRTQKGNNNAYCQNNEVSWINWAGADQELLDFTRKLIDFRRSHPAFCRRRWFQGQRIKGTGVEDIAWFLPDASEMTEEHWNNDFAKSLGVYLNGLGIHWVGSKGERIVDENFYIIFNAHYEALPYTLPPAKYCKHWHKVIDTSYGFDGNERFEAGSDLTVHGRSIVVLTGPANTKTSSQ
jgi:glycogen operon protein